MFHQIAVDGVSGAGKSTLSKLLAKKLNFLNINTGIFFRGITYYKIYNNIESLDILLEGLKRDVKFHHNKILILNQDITHLLFDQKISNNVTKISELPAIRNFILDIEIEYSKKADIVIEGRDIGSVVFPNAILKIFVNAEIKTRAKRRLKQLKEYCINSKLTIEEIQTTIESRDKLDQQRALAPLTKPKDAIEIFTDNKSVDEIADEIVKIYKQRKESSSL